MELYYSPSKITVYFLTIPKHANNLAEAALAVANGVISADGALTIYGLTIDELNGEIAKNSAAEEGIKKALADVERGFMTAETVAKRYGIDIDVLNERIEKNTQYQDALVAAASAVECGLMGEADAAAAFGVKLGDLNEKASTDRLNEDIAETTQSMSELADAYTSAYDAAYNSMNGQMGLFEDMSSQIGDYAKQNKESLDPQHMVDSLESQARYMEDYEANLEKIKAAGLDEGLLAKLSDGSVESAATLNELANAAPDDIQRINDAFAKVEEGKESFSESVAEMRTNFSKEFGKLRGDLDKSMDGMNMYDKARESAESTIQGYIDGFKSKHGDAYDAVREAAVGIQSIIEAPAAATSTSGSRLYGGATPASTTLASTTAGTVTVTVPGHADGTLNASDMFVAGEKGPELIVGAGGSAVFPAGVTSDIFSAANRSHDKKITIDISGSGEINVHGDADEETVWGYVAPKLKSAFMGIIKAEIFEEGDRAYAF